MNNVLRRNFILLLLIAMLTAFGFTEANASDEELVPLSMSKSNPLYPGVQYEQIAPGIEAAALMTADDLVYHDTVAAAGVDICEQMKERNTVVEVGFKTATGTANYVNQLFTDLFEAAFVHTGVPTEGDYIQWQWGHWEAYVYPSQSGEYYYLRYVYYVQYYDTAEQEKQMDIAVDNLLAKLDLQGKTDYQKICAIYDYICENVEYDYENLNDPYQTLKFTAYSALVNGKAVCQGYALLFYRLALEVGVDNRFIGGDGGGPHAWNIVELNGLYYNLDSTWDAGATTYTYFLRCNANFAGHVRDSEFDTTEFNTTYPMSNVDFDPQGLDVSVPEKPYKIVNVVSGVHVYWNSVQDVQKYGVWRSETGINGTYKWIANPSTNHFTDISVTSGKTYHYKITAINPYSNEHTAKSQAISIIYVSTPDITARYNKAAGIKLEWQKISGATGYAIYRKAYSGTDAWARVATITDGDTLTWTDTSVKNNNGTVYKYTIRALAGNDRKILSGCRSQGRTMARLTSRTLTVSSSGSGAVKCEWNTSKLVTGYEVRFIANGEVAALFTIGNYKTGVKTFSGLTSGLSYQIQVRTYKKVSGVGSFYSAWSPAKYVTL